MWYMILCFTTQPCVSIPYTPPAKGSQSHEFCIERAQEVAADVNARHPTLVVKSVRCERRA